MSEDATIVAPHVYKVLFAEMELPAGASAWREAEEHATENIGTTLVHALFVEPK